MIVGREPELAVLNRVFASKDSEFVAVYGRRRVGKTYLIREFFSEKKCFFIQTTGAYKEKARVQLDRFVEGISKAFFDNAPLKLNNWEDAFRLLHEQITKHPDQKIVIFFDELPWLVTKRSSLMRQIDYYWNHYWSAMKNIILIVCGSSAAWLIKNIIHNKGGLHNRVTCEIRLMPFNLYETKAYLNYRKVKLTDRHILSLYMALGGVPYYLKYIEPGISAAQNIQNIVFSQQSPLMDEFKKLFDSLFENAHPYIEIIHIVARGRAGVSRSEIHAKAKLSANGGRLTERLNDLCQAGFLEEKLAWQMKAGSYYRLIDEFTLFQLHWVIVRKNKRFPPDYWLTVSDSQRYKTWAGYAFESVCMKHIDQVIRAANIKSVEAIDSWRFIPKKQPEQGAQIDLLIERRDDAITLCEIKFTDEPFYIDKHYAKVLQNKIQVFAAKTKTKKQLFLLMICANGLKPSMYSEEMIHALVTLEDLFEPVGH